MVEKREGRLQVCPDWRLSAWGRCRHLEVVQPMWLVRGTQLAFSDLSYAGNGDKKERNCQLWVKFWFGGGATVAGVIVQLPGVLLVIEVRLSIVSTYRQQAGYSRSRAGVLGYLLQMVCQSSIFICGLHICICVLSPLKASGCSIGQCSPVATRDLLCWNIECVSRNGRK